MFRHEIIILTFEHVSKIYKGQKRAVDDLNFQIEKGEFIVLIGPSGCGKTTTMKMINRLIEPTEGTIFLNGENIMHMDPSKKNLRNVGTRLGLILMALIIRMRLR